MGPCSFRLASIKQMGTDVGRGNCKKWSFKVRDCVTTQLNCHSVLAPGLPKLRSFAMPDDLQREIFGGSDDDDLSSEEGVSFHQTEG